MLQLCVQRSLPPVDLLLPRLATGHRGVAPDAEFALDHGQGFSAAEDNFLQFVTGPHAPRFEPVTKRLRIDDVAIATDANEQPADEAVVTTVPVNESGDLNQVEALDLLLKLL